MQIPSSTYRLQLSPEFTFSNLKNMLGYLERLQVSTLYSAPFFESRKGSMHGYDIIDPFQINKAIGNLDSFREISGLLKKKGMNWLQDIVPNHMAFHPSNPWIQSILEHGPRSEFYHFFDINWNYPEWEGKVMAPFLGDSLEKVISRGELQLIFNAGGFYLKYFEHEYPASAESYPYILSEGGENPALENWKGKLQNNPPISQWRELKTSFFEAAQEDGILKNKINTAVLVFNTSGDSMRRLLEIQFFRPVHWKESERKINFRRFFTINDLICLRMEDEKVFKAYHTFIHQLCNEGLITGLRIDHIDGLFDPKDYLEKLSAMLGHDFYIIIEKILDWDEKLPENWPMQGTSGYHFLAMVNNLFTASQNEDEFRAGYKNLNPEIINYKQLVYDKKSFFLNQRMAGELQNLWDILVGRRLLPEEESFSRKDGMKALSAFLSAFPVYRIYPTGFPLTDMQQQIISEAYEIARDNEPGATKELDYLRELFIGKAGKDPESMHYFLQRCQQFTGPLAAKGVEDTSFYIFNQLISHNEVGDSPHIFGIGIEGFHDLMIQRKATFPLSINATATHDTKRGEDARMRINVLSEVPGEWFKKVKEWNEINKSLKTTPGVPDKNEEYFIYQALIGAMAFGPDLEEDFITRTQDYLQKVLREAKVHSFWSEPDEAYERAVTDFVKVLLEYEPFRTSFDPFRKKIAFYGAINSLGQSLLKITAPGIPDIYQGSELWDLSYVDPDNRRPVDYELRLRFLEEFDASPDEVNLKQLELMMMHYENGKIKMFTLYKALRERRMNQHLFDQGQYTPIPISGDMAHKAISYARHHGDEWYITVIPLGASSLSEAGTFPLGNTSWKDGYLNMPKNAPSEWTNVYTGQSFSSGDSLALALIFAFFPVALLKSKGTRNSKSNEHK